MQIRLGYVAVPLSIKATSSSIVTYSHYKKLGVARGNEKLHKVIMSNFEDLKKILNYNIKNEISFFRMTSNLIPLGTHPEVNYEIFLTYKEQFIEIGNIIKQNDMRIDTHPDQFCVLNSINEVVVTSSINILKFHQSMFKAMGIDGKMILHVGSSAGGKRNAMKRFKENFLKLDPLLQKMIILENDDKVFNIRNTLKLCEDLKIPMVLDYHHHLCNNNGEKITDFIEKIFATWDNQTLNPKLHFSSPKNKKEKRSHSEYIEHEDFLDFIEKIKFTNKDIDIMLEAKAKDEALFRLIRQIKYEKEYKFIKNTVFLI
jgi:UV DNA damage endonuclease